MEKKYRTSSQSRANGLMAAFLVAVAIMSTIPLGSNRSVPWALECLAVGGAGAIYLLFLLRKGAEQRYRFRQMPLMLTAAALFLAWSLVQILPVFGGLMSITGATGIELDLSTISVAPNASLLALVRVTGSILFAFLVLQVSVNPERARKMRMWLFGWMVLYAILAIFQETSFPTRLLVFDKWAYEGSATGSFVNRNSFATYMAMGVVLGISIAMERFNKEDQAGGVPSYLSNTRIESILILMATGIIFVAVLESNSRMGIAVALIGSMTVAALMFTHRFGAKALYWVFGGSTVVGLLGIAGLLMTGQTLFVRAARALRDFEVREQLYYDVWAMIMERPFLGYGLDSFVEVYPMFKSANIEASLAWDKTHSTYLAHWLESGLIVGSLPIIAFIAIAVYLFRQFTQAKADSTRVATALSVIVIGALHSLVDFSLEMQANVFTFLLIVALGLSRGASVRRAKKTKGE